MKNDCRAAWYLLWQQPNPLKSGTFLNCRFWDVLEPPLADMAYAITLHKSQCGEVEVVMIPVLNQHFRMLFRNLLCAGLWRTRKLSVFGTRKALAMAVKNQDTGRRQTALRELLRG